MALSIRHSPYSIPSPRFNSMSTYNPPFTADAATISGVSTYNMPSSSMLGLQSSMFSSMSPIATACGTTINGRLSPAMNFLPAAMNYKSAPCSSMENNSEISSRSLTDTSTTEQSPGSYSSDSPNSPPDISVEDSTLTSNAYEHCGTECYSQLSPSSNLGSLVLSGNHSPPPLPGSALPYATPPPATMLPTPTYPSQDYSTGPLSTASMPMPMWSPYPSLRNIGPIPNSSIPKLSYDSPRYKLTPERAIPLIKWFEEHKEHPYPTRHEKISLCQSTQLTFTQVSTWFANARRRMKKVSEDDDSSSNHGSSSGSDCEASPDCNSAKLKSPK